MTCTYNNFPLTKFGNVQNKEINNKMIKIKTQKGTTNLYWEGKRQFVFFFSIIQKHIQEAFKAIGHEKMNE